MKHNHGASGRGPNAGAANLAMLKRTVKKIFSYYPVLAPITLACILFSSVVSSIPALFTQNVIQVIEKWYVSRDWAAAQAELTPILTLLIVLYALSILAILVQKQLMAYMTQGFLNKLRQEMFGGMQDLPIRYFDTHQHGDIMSFYTNDIDTLRQLVSEAIPAFIQSGAIVLVVLAIMLYFSRRVPQAAACLAYFVLLTVFPVLICVSYILGMVNIDIVSLMDQLQPLLPEAALDVLESYLRYISFHQTPGLFLAGLAGCWFSAAAAFRTITRVIIDMYEDVSQSMVRGMVASILFPLGLLVTVDLSVIVVVTGQRTLAAVAQRFPFWDHVLNLWSWTRYVLLFSIFFLFILAVLNMAAPFGTPRLPVLLSSLVSALALVVSSAVFSWFISMSSRYSLVYGSLVSLIILLIWLYLCGQILFIGIVFTSVWYKHWRRRRLTDPDD